MHEGIDDVKRGILRREISNRIKNISFRKKSVVLFYRTNNTVCR